MFRTVSFLFAALVAVAIAPAASSAQAKPTPPAGPAQKAVLVTGASTGIGRRITERLAANGYFVYAGARKDSDLQALGAIKNVQAVRLDVTSPQEIAAAVDTVTKGGRGLYGLVNNAGVGTSAPLLETSQEEFDLMMSVNVEAPWRVTRAFVPLLTAQKGRVATIGSISGIVASKRGGAYAMSKHAIEGFADSLAQELAPLGVQVSLVEPGAFNSEIGRNAMRRVGGDVKQGDRSQLKTPDEVAAAVELALFDGKPKMRYLVAPDALQAEATIRAQIQRLVQLNEKNPYTYDREALVKMLDEALAKSRP